MIETVRKETKREQRKKKMKCSILKIFIKKLRYFHQFFISPSPQIIVDGFLNLKALTLSYTSISKEATVLLFSLIARNENLKLRTLNLGRHPQNARNSHLPAVEPDVFATAICKLENVEVDYNNLSFDQMDALFSKMTLDQHSLKSLTVSYDKSLKDLNEVVVTQALITLQHIEFHDLPQRYFKHFIEKVKVTPGTKNKIHTDLSWFNEAPEDAGGGAVHE